MLAGVLLYLEKTLYPGGRAFRMPDEGVNERLHNALNVQFEQANDDAIGILDAIMPDNPNFTQADADDWYVRLGIFNSGAVSFNDMKLAIAQKQSFPGVPLGRQMADFIQAQLQAAGFNVFVWENVPVQTPAEVLGVPIGNAVYGEISYGEANYGSVWADEGISLVVSYIEEAKDADFAMMDDYRSAFFISDDPLPGFANVPLARKDEFRQLILNLKRAESVAILLINYV